MLTVMIEGVLGDSLATGPVAASGVRIDIVAWEVRR
jgi:hypothetical protein